MKSTFGLPEQLRSLSRFPVPVATAIGLAILLNLQISKVIHIDDALGSELIFALTGAFLASFAAHLWARSLNLGIAANLGIALMAAAAAATLQYFRHNLDQPSVIALLGLAFAAMVATHLRRAATIESFWRFNLQLGIAVAMALIAFLIVCGGLSLLLASVTFLFDFKFNSAYSHIWATGISLFAPLFALAMVPDDFDEPFALSAEPDLIEKAVSAVLNFALAPLILIYSAVLHVYAAKIAIIQSMPKGEVGWLVPAFGIIGTATYMVAYPWRDAGYRPVRWFMRSWFWLMIVPTVLLALAVWQRTAEYGVTPERYSLCLFAVWLIAMVAYLGSARGRIDLRVIPASLAIALVFSSFGPWGSAAVSVRSQLAELRQVLREENLLADGQLKLDPPRLESFKHLVASNERVASILKSLYDLDALERLAPIFAGVTDNPFTKHQEPEKRLAALGLRWELPEQSPPPAPPPTPVGISVDTGTYNRLVGPFWITPAGLTGCASDCPAYPSLEVGGMPLTLSGTVVTAGRNGDALSFEVFDHKSQSQKSKTRRPETVTRDAREGRDHAILVMVRPLRSTDDPCTKYEAWLLLKSISPTIK